MRNVEPTFREVSEVPAPVEKVWERVTSPEGINHELGPFLKMTMPRSFHGKSIGDVSPGTHIGKSLLLLFGLIPFGYDDITVTQIKPGRMFREESAMIGMRTWIHQRTLEPVDGKTIVTDAITLTPRLALPGLTRFLAATLAAFFVHRHKRLRGHFAAG